MNREKKNVCVLGGGGGGGGCSNTWTGKTKHQITYLYYKAEEIFPYREGKFTLLSK